MTKKLTQAQQSRAQMIKTFLQAGRTKEYTAWQLGITALALRAWVGRHYDRLDDETQQLWTSRVGRLTIEQEIDELLQD